MTKSIWCSTPQTITCPKGSFFSAGRCKNKEVVSASTSGSRTGRKPPWIFLLTWFWGCSFFTPDKIPRSTTEATTTSFPRADKHHVSWWGTATHKTPLTGSMPTFQEKSFAVHYHFWRVTSAENQLEDISRRKAKVDRFQLYALK